MVVDLSNDEISDIVSRLPVKSLLRFRSVSKQWCSLIDSNSFVKRHFLVNHSNKPKTLIIADWIQTLYSVCLDSLEQSRKLPQPRLSFQSVSVVKIIGSCNGLLCVLYRDINRIVIWNPATRKHVLLPQVATVNVSVHGFGYDLVSDDYKVVKVAQVVEKGFADSFVTGVYVYSLRSNSWRMILGRIGYKVEHDHEKLGTFACGSLHWVVLKKGQAGSACTCYYVGGFDLATEEYKILELPGAYASNDGGGGDHTPIMLLANLGGFLSLVRNYARFIGLIEVWVMKEYGVGKPWTKLFTLSRSEIDLISFVHYMIPLAYSKNGDELLLTLNCVDLFWYNFENNTVKFVDTRGLPKPFCPVIWLESFVSLGDISQNDE